MGRPRKNKEEIKINEETGEVIENGGGLDDVDIDAICGEVQASFGKDKGRAGEICAGDKIPRPTRDEEFVCWKDSPWQALTYTKGIPFGRIVQIAGRPDSGKTTHAMQFMKNAQNQGVIVIFWDVESKFSAKRFEKGFGGDSKKLITIRSKMILTGGDTIERTVHKVKSLYPDKKILIVWDSVGGTLAKNEDVEIKKDGTQEGGLDQGKQMAAAAKENGQVCRAFIRLMEKYRNREKNEETIAVLLINQTYADIGSTGQKQSGGQKVEFYSSLIVQLTRKGNITWVRDGQNKKAGIFTIARVVKNHLFDGLESIADMELAITANGIQLAEDFDKDSYKKFVENCDWLSDDLKAETDNVEDEE